MPRYAQCRIASAYTPLSDICRLCICTNDAGTHFSITPTINCDIAQQGQSYALRCAMPLFGKNIKEEKKNANALGLYESCGFRKIRTCNYYQVIEGGPARS